MTTEKQAMHAIVAPTPGGPEVLQLLARPIPQPAAGEVLLKVLAAGINRPDIMQRQGISKPPVGVTDVLGLEVCGIVTACGAGVSDRWLGKRMMALVPGGGYAPWCTAPIDHALAAPSILSDVDAAALPEGLFTVWHNLFELGQLRMGETVLIHGGSGGIGTLAIRMAYLAGARVITTISNPLHAPVLKAAGADVVICWKTEDFVSASLKATEGRGVDVVLDMVGGDYVMRNLQSMAFGGRHVSLSFMQGAKVEVDLMLVMQRQLSIHSSTMRPQSHAEKNRMATALRQYVLPLIVSGKLMPRVQQSFALSQAAEAHSVLEKGGVLGKLVLLPTTH